MRLVSSVEDVAALQVPNPDKVIYLTQTTLSLDDTAQIVQELRDGPQQFLKLNVLNVGMLITVHGLAVWFLAFIRNGGRWNR